MKTQKFFLGQNILITGASEGIGAALAEKLAAVGANLVLVARSEDKLHALAKKLLKPKQEISVLTCDLSQPEQVETLIVKLKKQARLDGIIHNAGVGLYGGFQEIPEAEIRRSFEINFFSIINLNRALIPQLALSPTGRIVMVSSVVSWRGIPRMSYYSSTKGALNLYTESLRTELRDTSIKVINVYPGRTKTNFTLNAYSNGFRPFSTEWGGTPVDKVANKILRAYQKGKRDEYVTPVTRLLVWFNFLFPKCLDWGMKKIIKKSN